MSYSHYQFTLTCTSSEDANKLYEGLQGDGYIDDETISIFAPEYDVEMDFGESWAAVRNNTVVLCGFSSYCEKEAIWNIIEVFKEKSKDYSVDIISYLIKIRDADLCIFQDFHYPAPAAIAEKLKENADLTDQDVMEEYQQNLKYIWGFEIVEEKRAEVLEEDEENIMCFEPGIIDDILEQAANGIFNDNSYYIQINSDGIVDEDTNLSYL